jgi:hypothetical protein
MVEITKDSFAGMDTDSKLNVLFDLMHGLCRHDSESEHECETRLQTCEVRFKRLERIRIWYPVAAGAGGVIGGFIAAWTQFKLKIFGG